MRLGAVLGGVAQGYEQAQKQSQELAIQKQQADFEAQQNALITQSQQWAKTHAQPGVVTGTDPGTMSESAHDLAKSYGASDAQLAAADAAGAQGYNALLASLHASGAQPPATTAPSPVGLPAASPVTINPGDPGYAPQAAPEPSTGGLQFTQTPGGAPSLDYTSSVIGHESSGNPNAQNPASTAGGLGQFTDGTWSGVLAKHAPDLVAGKTPAQIAELKFNPDLNRQAIGWLAQDNASTLAQAGVPVNPVSLAAAHSLGAGGAISVLKANPQAPLSSVLSAGAIAANPQYAKMTAGDFIAQTSQNMGGAGPQSSVNVALTPPAAAAPAQPQAGVSAPAAPPPAPTLDQYVGNVYDTPVGPRVTTNPTTRSQAEALRMQADNELKLGLRAKDGHLIGIDTLTAANTLAAQDQKLTEGQRQLDWQATQKSIQDAKTPDELTQILNKSSLVNAHLTLVANDNHTNFAWEARNPQTGTMYVVEQGTFPKVQSDLIALAGDPEKRQAFLDTQAKLQSDADLQAAQAYQARKSGAAAATNAQTNQVQVGLAAAKTPAEIGLIGAQTNAANAESSVNTANASRLNFEQGLRQQQQEIVAKLADPSTPPQEHAQLMQRYNALNGMVGAKFESTPGPDGTPQTHITYPNGMQTTIDRQGVEVPVGQDSRTWNKDPDIKSQAIQYGWHTDQATGLMQLGFSTNSGLLPNGQRGPVFSTNLHEVKEALHAQPSAARAAQAGLPMPAAPPSPQMPGYDQPHGGLGGR